MDRNIDDYLYTILDILVALLAEGVDRNLYPVLLLVLCGASPSSRRAWIEIFRDNLVSRQLHVAILAEGVDRNWMLERRIERREVALLAEGVDRNTYYIGASSKKNGRPPRGGRG